MGIFNLHFFIVQHTFLFGKRFFCFTFVKSKQSIFDSPTSELNV
jgi:hypothetical protein